MAELARLWEMQPVHSRVIKDPARAEYLRSNSNAIDLTETDRVVFMNKSKSYHILWGWF